MRGILCSTISTLVRHGQCGLLPAFRSFAFATLLLPLFAVAGTARGLPVLALPPVTISASNLALVINTRDELSRKIAAYYIEQRGIPAANIIRLDFGAQNSILSPQQFAVLQKSLTRQTGAHIKAYALTWAAPYRVGCMSITAAFAFGYDEAYCAKGCKLTKASDYGVINREKDASNRIRPAMLLAATSFEDAKALIDRGIAADGSLPNGQAWLLKTSDKARSARAPLFLRAQKQLDKFLPVHFVEQDFIKDKSQVMFYFTGKVHVSNINSNHYLPGAVADHLTSSGGQLTDSRQMSALRWLEAGLTGSYGTVVEPCAFPQKFPNPLSMIANYMAGRPLIDAYWRSVQMPGQGVFIGEPLSNPYYGYRFTERKGELYLHAPLLFTDNYRLTGSKDVRQPFESVLTVPVEQDGKQQLWILNPDFKYYRAEKILPKTQDKG